MRDDDLIASVAGAVEQVNKLVSVRPLKSRQSFFPWLTRI